jgi:hypothetical protein
VLACSSWSHRRRLLTAAIVKVEPSSRSSRERCLPRATTTEIVCTGATGLFYWIYNYPPALTGALFSLIFVVITWTATFMLRRYVHRWFHTERRANDMVGVMLSSFSVLYGILVALIAVAAYQNYGNVSDVVTKESSSLGALYQDLRGYPQPNRGRLQGALRDYTRYEIERDWPQQQRGLVPTEGTHRIAQFMDELLSFQPTQKSEEIIHAEALRQLNTYMSLRQDRLASIEEGIPTVLWWVMCIGAILTLLLVAMLDMEIHVHLILGAALSLFLGLIIYLIAAMDQPFRGHVSVTPEPFESVLRTLMEPDDAVNAAMAALVAKTSKLGPPHLKGTEPVMGRDAPGLYFGNTRVNNTFTIVDDVKAEHGGTASLFVRRGDDFVRVSTNVMLEGGIRAMGTLLDPRGPAIQAIRRGEAYYGEATILGKPYITGYEPIKDGAGDTIGIYYTGYLKP